ncbi:MAG: gliding motility-associated ABC transporter permease subunit GldF [Salinivirgaceae bacterium]|jgi:ABC-2 type transport system permease protein|nr:gliding motility-associated ABC transporter permease subunit GldF [Salinivirgaceae bacterium]
MFALYKKELASFFSSLTGYIVIIIFLTSSGLFMWVIPGQNNVLDAGYSNIDTFFILSPWVFMFLIPAITMRLFTDEIKTGTIELLMTRPLRDISVIMAKYYAAFSIAVISIIPTLIYFVSVYYLGNPIGNIDIGGTWGSYIGLLFLAAIYVAIGIFASVLTSNQIVAFILAAVLSFTLFYGFDALSLLFSNTRPEYLLQKLSINQHYQSISRGVIDTRDIAYFLSVTAIFILLAKFKLQSRKW